jgi:RepB plasmid partitioning protein
MTHSSIGYNNAEIAAEIDFTPYYIAAVCYLLDRGKERLLAAVERGVMPANIATEIARAPDGDIQRALAEAYICKRDRLSDAPRYTWAIFGPLQPARELQQWQHMR